MRFSLKTMLVVFMVSSIVLAIMRKLWVEDPESFFQVLSIGSTIGPFVLAVATIVWLGIRGCSSRSKLLIAWGVFLLLTPGLGMGARYLLLPTGQPIRVLSTKRLIENRLTNQVDGPWIWRELEYRASQGDLSKQQVDEALQILIAYLNKAKPASGYHTLPWQKKFISLARQKKLISDKVLQKLCDAYYFAPPQLQQITAIRQRGGRLYLHIDYGNPFEDSSGLGVKLIWHVNSVSIDGDMQAIEDAEKHFGRQWTWSNQNDLEAGEHEVQIEVECAYIDDSKLNGLDTNSLIPNQWPEAIKRWKTMLKATFQVEP